MTTVPGAAAPARVLKVARPLTRRAELAQLARVSIREHALMHGVSHPVPALIDVEAPLSLLKGP